MSAPEHGQTYEQGVRPNGRFGEGGLGRWAVIPVTLIERASLREIGTVENTFNLHDHVRVITVVRDTHTY